MTVPVIDNLAILVAKMRGLIHVEHHREEDDEKAPENVPSIKPKGQPSIRLDEVIVVGGKQEIAAQKDLDDSNG